jgi:hypothetical protein
MTDGNHKDAAHGDSNGLLELAQRIVAEAPAERSA